MKEPTRGAIDQNSPDALQKPKICNIIYTVKVIYLGVVACLQEKNNSDGRIMLVRVSCAKVLTRAS